MTPKILIIEDEPDLLDAVFHALKRDGMKPLRAEDGETGLKLARSEHPDLILLDLMLPGVSGLEICRQLRMDHETARIPIIMVTAKAEETDAIIGLGVGADDYVKKPFGLKELIARIRAVLRRTATADEPAETVVRYDELEVDPMRHEIRVDGNVVVCTATEFRLLHHMARHPGRVFTRAQLLERAIGNDVIVVERNIDVHVAAVRRKLGDSGRRIVTIRGVGYKFSEN